MVILCLLMLLDSFAQNKDKIEGPVMDKQTGKPVSAAESDVEGRLRALEQQVATLEYEQTSSTTFSGYMDFHYNNPSPGNAIVDFHRYVLLFSHEFSESIRFYSELEIEHAFIKGGSTSNGEVELEQAFVDFHVNPGLAIRAGIVLVPMGIQNERHEAPAYFGVERHL